MEQSQYDSNATFLETHRSEDYQPYIPDSTIFVFHILTSYFLLCKMEWSSQNFEVFGVYYYYRLSVGGWYRHSLYYHPPPWRRMIHLSYWYYCLYCFYFVFGNIV